MVISLFFLCLVSFFDLSPSPGRVESAQKGMTKKRRRFVPARSSEVRATLQMQKDDVQSNSEAERVSWGLLANGCKWIFFDLTKGPALEPFKGGLFSRLKANS